MGVVSGKSDVALLVSVAVSAHSRGMANRSALLPDELESLRALLHKHSPDRVAVHLGVSRYLALSAAVGLPLEEQHLQRIRNGLEACARAGDEAGAL